VEEDEVAVVEAKEEVIENDEQIEMVVVVGGG